MYVFRFSLIEVKLLTVFSGDEKTVDRRVYLGSPLSVQVVTPKQHDYQLCQAMEIIDNAVRSSSLPSSRL